MRYIAHAGFGTEEDGSSMYYSAAALAMRHGVVEFDPASEETPTQADDVHLYPPVGGVLQVRTTELHHDGGYNSNYVYDGRHDEADQEEDEGDPEEDEDYDPPVRYILHPGSVISNLDGQLHYISANQLRNLYRVPRNGPCVIVGQSDEMFGYEQMHNDIHLHPRPDGDYNLLHPYEEQTPPKKTAPPQDFSKRIIRVRRKE
jgi:hypothetical protein